jgi:hypothetical protein
LQGGVFAGFLSLKYKEYVMDKKNPLLAGLINVLVPGSGYWYVDQDRARFIKTLIIGVVAIAGVIVLGALIQNTTGFPLPQGLCPGVLLLGVLVPLFLGGQRAAVHHNSIQNTADVFVTRQGGTHDSQVAKNQSLRDKGLISEQEYNSRKENLTSKKK